ncbi:F-box protein CPR1-like [Cornus florida]|uniref:F-box protein CPR1-like n=1 Tax=Cornus florida TaxID=4283 RepID=UPI002898950E|nr:F-box protein CPR1-like [Cornus florida]
MSVSMSELPEDLLKDILSRLPVKDLLRLRCVSKQWCALIDSPIFIKLQLNRSLQTGTNLNLICTEYGNIFSVDLDMLEGVLKLGGSVPPLDVVEVDYPINPFKCEFILTEMKAVTLLNPSTKEYKILPPLPPHNDENFSYDKNWDDEFFRLFHEIMYDSVGDDYKVVRIVQFKFASGSFSSEIMVYSLRLNMWRRVYDSFYYYIYLSDACERDPCVVVNGALHLLACEDPLDLFNTVVGFDPVNEVFLEVEAPSVSGVSNGTLGVLDGCLCILYAINEEYAFELWVMNDYMVKESWTKLFTVFTVRILNLIRVHHILQCPRVLAYSKINREVILLQMFGKLVWYDLKEERGMDLNISSSLVRFNVKSLVKLNHDQ